MPESTYLIIGNGAAGLSAAQEIRRRDTAGRITLVSDEGVPYYYRASLSEWMAGGLTDETLLGRTPAFYDALGIERITGHVVRVDPDTRRVHLTKGTALSYNKLLIATGARANVYPVPGLEEILVFRTLADARQIKERLGCCGRALIIGGGILGLELAGALHRMGIPKIAIAQRSSFVGRPLLDASAAAWLTTHYLEPDGISVFLNDTVDHVVDNIAHLKSGVQWEFDMIVQAVGVTPVFPETPGLAIGRGIRIDARARTNLPHVYAAGDCSETQMPGSERWQTTRIWLDCARQGRVAGSAMSGGNRTLFAQPFYNASVIYRARYSYLGSPHAMEAESHVWQTDDAYRKVSVVAGKLTGALLLNARHGDLALLKAIGQPVARWGAAVAHPDFPWNDLTGRDWDYRFY